MKILVLGGAGSVGRKVCEIGLQKNHQVAAADIKPLNLDGVNFSQTNILDFDNLKKVIDDSAPDIVVNCLNLATIFSRGSTDQLQDLINFHIGLYKILLSHKKIHYIQVGTTGTGGMGINVPFSHGEDLSKLPLFFKASFAGACTSLLTLLSRSFGENEIDHRVSEVKPGLAIFQDDYKKQDINGCVLVATDGGENGNYTYNELAILTAFMGFTTAQKIAEKVFSIIGEEMKEKRSSSYDVIEALNQAIVSQDEEDLEIRDALLEKMASDSGDESIIATGNLGPPSLTRDLILASIALTDHCKNESEFKKALTESVSCTQTLAYIGSVNKNLGDYLKNECNYDNFLTLRELVDSHHLAHPWQLVAKKLRSKILK